MPPPIGSHPSESSSSSMALPQSGSALRTTHPSLPARPVSARHHQQQQQQQQHHNSSRSNLPQASVVPKPSPQTTSYNSSPNLAFPRSSYYSGRNSNANDTAQQLGAGGGGGGNAVPSGSTPSTPVASSSGGGAPLYSPFTPSSPGLSRNTAETGGGLGAVPGTPSGTGSMGLDDPTLMSFVGGGTPFIKKSLGKDSIRTNVGWYHLGEKWKVEWAAWEGSPLGSGLSCTKSVGKPMQLDVKDDERRNSATSATSSSSNSSSGRPLSLNLTARNSILEQDSVKPPSSIPKSAQCLSNAYSAAPSTSSSSSSSKPLKHPALTNPATLKDKLSFLRSIDLALDPIECAQVTIRALATTMKAKENHFGLFSHLESSPISLLHSSSTVGSSEGPKGKVDKGKAKDTALMDSSSASDVGLGAMSLPRRILWVFSITRGGSEDDEEKSDMVVDNIDMGELSRSATESKGSLLVKLQFKDLTELGRGSLDHRTLFPAFYDAHLSSSISQNTSNPKSQRNELGPIAKKSLLRSPFYPTAINYTSPFGAPISPPSRAAPHTGIVALTLKKVYDALTSGISELMLVHMIHESREAGDLPSTVLGSRPLAGYLGGEKVTRLDDALLLLAPGPSNPFPNGGRVIVADAVKAKFRPHLMMDGIMFQSSVRNVALRSFPSLARAPSLLPMTPVILIPYQVEAYYIRMAVFPDPGPSPTSLSKMRSIWSDMLQGTGLELLTDETWLTIRIESMGSARSGTRDSTLDSMENSLDVTWPASLCLLDGNRLQPNYTTTPKATHSNLPTTGKTQSPTDSDPVPLATTSTPACSVPPLTSSSVIARALDSDLRRRFASVLQSQHSFQQPFRDQIVANAQGSAMLIEMFVKEQEEREKEEKRVTDAVATEATLDAQRNQFGRSKASGAGKEIGESLSPGAPGMFAGESKQSGTAHPSVVAGAPINMRTPISLGGSSTEAPSPADGLVGVFFSQMTDGQVNANLPTKQLTSIDAEHVYPSPSDAQAVSSVQGDQLLSQSTEQPMENAFPDFDWGDDFTSGAIRSNLPQDFDDGMMMGLTDDDFSFFDDPAPHDSGQQAGRAQESHGMVQSDSGTHFGILNSAGPSPVFVDHFPHLTAVTPFASAGSPGSPFAQMFGGSPHLQGSHQLPALSSPGVHTHSLELLSMGVSSGNILGLASTPTPVSQPQDGSPFKAPKALYAPSIEETDDEIETPQSASALVSSALSIAGTPGVGLSSSPSHRQGSLFDAVPFGLSHTKTDCKYDARKGKFGLPSPESDDMRDLPTAEQEESSSSPVKRQRLLAHAPWYSIVCHPKFSVVNALKSKRIRLSACQRRRSFKTFAVPNTHLSKVHKRSWLKPEDPYDSQQDDDSSDDDVDMDADGQDGMISLSNSRKRHSDSQTSDTILASLGAPLLLLRYALGAVLTKDSKTFVRVEGNAAPPTVATKASMAAESALETTISLLADQFIYNPSYRANVLESRISNLAVTAAEKQVSAVALRLVDTRLCSFCNATNPGVNQNLHTKLQRHEPAAILFRAQQTIMQASTSATSFWRPMGFEPLAGPKDVTAFAVYEEGGPELNIAVKNWLSDLSDAYQASRFGKHTPGQAGQIEDGLAALPAGSLIQSRIREEFRTFCSLLTEANKTKKHVVIYLLTPPGTLSMSSTGQLVLTLQQLLRCRTGTMSMAVYPLPISIIQGGGILSMNDSHAGRFDKLALSVYDQLLVPVAKLRFPTPETFPSATQLVTFGAPVRLFQCPAVTISPSRPLRIDFELKWPPSSLEVMHRHRLLHVGYTCEPARVKGDIEWIIVSCIDEKGEIWKTLPRLVRTPPNVSIETSRARSVWTITKMLAETADVEWRVIVTRVGFMPEAEVKAWDLLLKEQLVPYKRPLHVTITCTDFDPPMSIVKEKEKENRPLSLSSSTSLSSNGDGENLSSIVAPLSSSKSPYLSNEPSHYACTPTEPIAVHHVSNLVAFCTTYLIHVPRIASLAHSIVDPFIVTSSPISPISVYATHFLLMHGSRSSSLAISQREHVYDVRQSFVELAALGQIRWGSSGKVAWHLEAVAAVAELIRTEDQSR